MENINNLFDLIKKEASKTDLPNEKTKQQFPFELLYSIWDSLLKIELDESTLDQLKSYLNYADIRYFTLKYLKADYYSKNEINEQCLESLLNVFAIMPGLSLPGTTRTSQNGHDNDLEDDENKKSCDLFAIDKTNLTQNSNITQLTVNRKLFSDCFVNFLKNKINLKLYKKVLVKLPEKILPKMSNPLMLADFLTRSYNIGGLISVLALNSLFILINNYNLEYPNFYQKLYQLLDASIFYTKYKDKFFQLLDVFLMSTHLSSILVASFIKKLSRMCLTCPPADLKFMVLFIYNLLIRHQNCKVLIHNNSRKIADLKDDPFDLECNDYNKSNALKSSLWEIQSLKQHYAAYVSKEVEKLNNLSTSIEYPLDEAFENNTYDDLIAMELDSNKATANCAVNYFFDLEENTKSFRSNFYDTKVSDILKIN